MVHRTIKAQCVHVGPSSWQVLNANILKIFFLLSIARLPKICDAFQGFWLSFLPLDLAASESDKCHHAIMGCVFKISEVYILSLWSLKTPQLCAGFPNLQWRPSLGSSHSRQSIKAAANSSLTSSGFSTV